MPSAGRISTLVTGMSVTTSGTVALTIVARVPGAAGLMTKARTSDLPGLVAASRSDPTRTASRPPTLKRMRAPLTGLPAASSAAADSGKVSPIVIRMESPARRTLATRRAARWAVVSAVVSNGAGCWAASGAAAATSSPQASGKRIGRLLGEIGLRVIRPTRGKVSDWDGAGWGGPDGARTAAVGALGQAIPDPAEQLVFVHPDLGHGIALAHGHGAVRERLAIHGAAERRSRLVHPAVAAADGTAVVIEAGEAPLEVVVDPLRPFRHPVLLDQRQDRGLDRRDARVEAQHHTGLALDLLLPVGVHQQGEGHPVGAGGGLHDVGQVPLVRGLVEVLELLPRILLVPPEVVVAPVVDALDLV